MKNLTLLLLFVLAVMGCTKENDCPAGYMGSDCTQQITPTSMRVTNIRILNFPATDSNGAGWDLTSGADLFVKFSLDNTILYTHDEFYQNAISGVSYDFKPTINLNIDRPTNRYVLGLFDYDDGLTEDDVIGAVSFTPYQDGNGFPPVIDIDFNGIHFQLDVVYTF